MEAITLASLHVHPVKSCAGHRVPSARLTADGLEHDRHWMIAGPDGTPITQREVPRMALLRPVVDTGGGLSLAMDGLPALRVEAGGGSPVKASVWGTEVDALDQGEEAARWVSDAVGRPARLLRFDTRRPRRSDPSWTGDVIATTRFADEFPLLVASAEGIAELNRRLAARGLPPAGIERFRPNIVLSGLQDPHGEDFLDELRFATPEGPVVIKLVKPCVRCTIPSVDPATGEQGHEPGDTLAGYRADSRMDGGVTFGMNAVIVEGQGRTLAVGQRVETTLAF